MPEQLPPIPKFLIIGAQKGATRWLRLNLGRHPEIFTPDSELEFFNHPRYSQGLDSYRRQFEDWEDEPVVGEATPGYMIFRCDPQLVAERIATTLPDVALFAVLRDPVDRLYSAFIHHMRRGRIDPEEDIIERVRRISPDEDRQQLVAGGWYARSLRPYLDQFGDSLTIFLNEDARADPKAVYRTALQEIGVDDSFVPEQLSEIVFSRVPPKGSRYWQDGKRRKLTAEERTFLREYFLEDIEELEELVGLDLSRWKHS